MENLEIRNEKRIFYKTAFALIIPMALQNIINVGVTSAEVFMMGKVGEKALSGVSLGGQFQFIMTFLLFGLTSGVAILSAQYWGKKDVLTIEKILGIALKLAVSVGLIFTLAIQFFPEALMHIYSSDDMVIAEGVKYLRIVSLSYPFVAVTMVYINTMRSMERVKIATFVYLCSMIINISLDAVLIFGFLGFPALGSQGAAIGMLIARILETAIIVLYDRKINPIFRFKFEYLKTHNKLLLRDFFIYSIPVIINEIIWGVGSSMNSAVLGHMGSAVAAASSVAQVSRQLATVISFGAANATAIMLGKAIGESREDLARVYSVRFINISMFFGICGGLSILAARPIVISQMNLSAESREYLSMMMFVMAYFIVAQAFNTTVIVGVLRSGGDIRFGLFVDIVCMWCWSLPLGFLAAFVFKWPVTTVYLILMCDEIVKIPMSLYRYRRYKWVKNITR